MTTTAQIVERAYRKVGIVAHDDAMTADQGAGGVYALNAMMHGWGAFGITYEHTDLSLTDTFPMPDKWHEGVVYMLAQRLAPDFGMIGPDADRWFRALQAGYSEIEPMTFDAALTNTPTQRRWSY